MRKPRRGGRSGMIYNENICEKYLSKIPDYSNRSYWGKLEEKGGLKRRANRPKSMAQKFHAHQFLAVVLNTTQMGETKI